LCETFELGFQSKGYGGLIVTSGHFHKITFDEEGLHTR
jgi:hypothetical protein